jgi:hypothetical protein
VKSNPFATRFVAPGKLAWHSRDGHSLDDLSRRFIELHSRAAIVGPHGSGKTTLLEHLVPMLGETVLRQATYECHTEADSRPAAMIPLSHQSTMASSALTADLITGSRLRVVWLQLRGRTASRQLLSRTRSFWSQSDVLLVIDGYEQLSRLVRCLVVMRTWMSSARLLVTSHRPTCLPTLIETRVDVAVAQSLLEHLLPADMTDRQHFLDSALLQQMLIKHRGNLREVFMHLYDAAQTKIEER